MQNALYMYDYVRIPGVSSRQVLQVLVKVSEKGPEKVRKVLCKVPVGYRSRYSLESWEGSQEVHNAVYCCIL